MEKQVNTNLIKLYTRLENEKNHLSQLRLKLFEFNHYEKANELYQLERDISLINNQIEKQLLKKTNRFFRNDID